MARTVKTNVDVKPVGKKSDKNSGKKEEEDLQVIERGITQFVVLDEVVNGSFTENLEGVGGAEDFWVGVPIDVFMHQHLRVSQLRGFIRYQYRYYEGRVYFRMTEYWLSSRPSDKVWRRANIDFKLHSRIDVRKNSPDEMIMDAQWHQFIMSTDAEVVSGIGVRVNFRVEYDGTNNGVGEKDSWGQQVRLVDRG